MARDNTSDPSAGELLARYRPDLAAAIVSRGCPAYRAEQILGHLFKQPGDRFTRASSLPAELRTALDHLGSSTLRTISTLEDEAGTAKFLLEAVDGARIEAVVMQYQSRVTVCVSSQVGCSLGCAFCATARMGLVRNLTTAEIVDQVRIAEAYAERKWVEEEPRLHRARVSTTYERIVSHVVVMGMGEPLLNLRAVLGALAILKNPLGMNMRQRALSLSTAGIPAGIGRLAEAEPQVNLALSLHSPNDEIRTRLMPVNRRHSIELVLAATDDHFRITHRKLMVEYMLLRGINDSQRDAHALARLLRGKVAMVNLIPWNPAVQKAVPARVARRTQPARQTHETGRAHRGTMAPRRDHCLPDLEKVGPQDARMFRDILIERGVEATVRQSRGLSINAACGQLVTRTGK